MQRTQLSVAIAAAVLSSVSFAGQGGISVSGVRTYATEALTASATAQVATPSLAYSLTNPFAANTRPIIKLSLDNSAKIFTACPTLTINKDSTLAAVTVAVDPAATGTVNATTGVTTCVYQPAAPLTASVPTNATLDFTPATSTIGNLSGLTASTPISGTVAVFDAGGNSANDGNSAILVRAADAFAISAVNSAAYPSYLSSTVELSQINLVSGQQKSFTTTTPDVTNTTGYIAIGAVAVTELPGQQFDSAAAPVEVNFANLATRNLTVTVNGTFQLGAQLSLWRNPGVSSTNLVGFYTITAADVTAGQVTLPVLDTNPVSTTTTPDGPARVVYIAYDRNGSGTAPVIPPSQFQVSAKFSSATSVTLSDKNLATTNIYNLTLNQAQVDLRQFWSTATSNANGGWVQLVRIINTSNNSAVLSGQYIAESTGALVGSPTPLNTTAVPAGAVLTMTAAQIEGAIGVPPAGIHRLRITAPVDSLRVQSFLRDPGGRHTAIADQGAQGTGNAATGNK